MRIIPGIGRKNKPNKERASAGPQHRRSWHVGTSALPDSRQHRQDNNKGRKAERRPSGGKHHKTWHFFRASRHSTHSRPGYTYEHEEHYLHKDREEEKEEQVHEAGATTGQRKTFKQCERMDGSDKSNSNRHKGKENWVKRARRKTGRFFRGIEEFLFPGCPNSTHHTAHGSNAPRIRGGVLLQSCQTADEHRAKVQEVVSAVRNLHGAEGLRAIGLEYRFLPCPEHCGAKAKDNDAAQDDENPIRECAEEKKDESCGRVPDPLRDITETPHRSKDHSSEDLKQPQSTNDGISNSTVHDQGEKIDCTEQSSSSETASSKHLCEQCSTQLFHIETNTRICIENRKLFIADGDMYDVIGRLCQENAHEIMQRKFNLQWVTVCTPDEDEHHPLKRNGHEPIRALVNPEHPLLAAENPGNVSEERLRHFSKQPTLLIITGKGHVRAGIFSRFHIMSNGMESSTAIPLIQEARFRELNIVIMDPNVHGESLGMMTFEKSMAKLFHFWERDPVGDDGVCDGDENDMGPDGESRRSLEPFTNRDLYILSHSASGSHLARYLMEKSEQYLPHIRAIAFTDSTHNIQWARQRGKHDLVRLLESPACVYFRCACEDKDANWHKHRAGEEAPRDTFWTHRFGDIKTCWAGTKEHALTNWFAHRHIWEHYDNVLYGGPQQTEIAEGQQHEGKEL